MELEEEQKNPETEDMPLFSSDREETAMDKQDTVSQSSYEKIRQQAHEYLKSGHWSQAAESFLELLDLNAQDEDVLQGAAMALDGIGRYDALLSTAQCLLDINPNSAMGLASKARALQKLERLSEAMIANDQALLLDTNLTLAWINRSGLQVLQQKFPEALRSSQRAIELDPNDARAWANRGVALLNLNRLPEALEAFNHSLAQNPNPNHLFALQMKGEILSKLGRISEGNYNNS